MFWSQTMSYLRIFRIWLFSNFSWSRNDTILMCNSCMPGLHIMLLIWYIIEIFNDIYFWVILVNSESFLLLGLVKYMLQLFLFFFFYYVNFFENVLIFVYLLCPRNSIIDSKKRSITPEWLVVEIFPTPRWTAYLMLCRLVYNITFHFNELSLA